jgi:pilus assembly protein CpaB
MLDVLRRRLPRSSVAWFAGAAFAAGAAWFVTQARIASIEATRPDLGPPIPVVRAATDLLRGTTIADGSVEVADIPSSLVPPGALTESAGAAGRVLVADLAEGEVLTATRLAGAGTGPIAALVPPGLRAFVLPIGPPEGTLEAGDEIDVLATYGANAGRPYTETVATAIEVLDVVETDQPMTAGPGGVPQGPPVVVVVDPATVERLARAASLAILSVAIVGVDGSVGVAPAASAVQPSTVALGP